MSKSIKGIFGTIVLVTVIIAGSIALSVGFFGGLVYGTDETTAQQESPQTATGERAPASKTESVR